MCKNKVAKSSQVFSYPSPVDRIVQRSMKRKKKTVENRQMSLFIDVVFFSKLSMSMSIIVVSKSVDRLKVFSVNSFEMMKKII